MRRWGDRKDGALLRDIDSMHYFMPLMYPNRCDNEAFISVRIDLTRAEEWLAKQNAADLEYKYNLFQLIVTAMLRAITLRPQMNRFAANCNLYQRNHISAAFVVKKIFSDHGEEALAKLVTKPGATVHTIHDDIFRKVSSCRSEKKDASSAAMDVVRKIPGKHLLGRLLRFLDRHGWIPAGIIATDPYYCSVVLTNLGSIGMDAGYHHLTNWGTNSVFCTVGLKKKRPFYDENGGVEMRQSVELGLTVDERIADGYYFSKTVRLLKTLLENPELLEQPMEQEVEY